MIKSMAKQAAALEEANGTLFEKHCLNKQCEGVFPIKAMNFNMLIR